MPAPLEEEKKSLFDVILNENSVGIGYDEITKFVHGTLRGSRRLDTL